MSNPKVALVTGGAKRIGKSICQTLHLNGYNVVIHYNNSKQEAQNLAESLNSIRSNSATIVKANLNEDEQLLSLATQSIDAWGKLDVLVNNASQFYPTAIGEVNNDHWNDLFASNVKAPFFLIQALAKELKTNNGCIINMVDIHAEKPLAGYSVYCMAKSALISLTKSLSDELAPKIRVNGIAPGPILWHDNPISEGDKEQVLKEVSLSRLGTPEDIAQGVLYLCNAKFVTGHILKIDGGRSVKGSQKA